MTHEGPNYELMKKTGITPDTNWDTTDRLRGVAPKQGFEWTDRFNKKHFVRVDSYNTEVRVMFPISNCAILFRAENIDNPGNVLYTRFSADHMWCDATFTYQSWGPLLWQGEHVWGQFTFYKDNDISSKCTEWNVWDNALSKISHDYSRVGDFIKALVEPPVEPGECSPYCA